MSSLKTAPKTEVNFYGVTLKKLPNDRFMVSGTSLEKGWNPWDEQMGAEIHMSFKDMITNKVERFSPKETFNWILPMGELTIDITMTLTNPEGQYVEDFMTTTIYYGGHSFVE